jgi:hypothetical protein
LPPPSVWIEFSQCRSGRLSRATICVDHPEQCPGLSGPDRLVREVLKNRRGFRQSAAHTRTSRAFEPIRNLLHGGPPNLTLSVLDRENRKSTTRRNILQRPHKGHMSVEGQSRRFNDVRATSALPLITDLRRKDRHVRFVPIVLKKSFFADD